MCEPPFIQTGLQPGQSCQKSPQNRFNGLLFFGAWRCRWEERVGDIRG